VSQEEMTDPQKTIVIANPVFQVKQSPKRNAKRLDCFALLAMTVYMERIPSLVVETQKFVPKKK